MNFIILSILVSIGLAVVNSAPSTTNSQINRIIGGSSASIKQFPYHVSLHHYHGIYVCGGSIIAKNYVLTAAHCVGLLHKGFVRAGSVLADDGGTLSHIAEIKRHNFTYETSSVLVNDIAILRVEPGFVFSDTIKPIELYDGDLDQAAANGKTTVISGFGATEEGGEHSIFLMAVKVLIAEKKICSKYYEEINYGAIGEDRFCAGAMEGGLSVCYGDSGGPLVMDGRQIGIVSYARGCARPNFPAVHTNVAYYLEWIRKNMEENEIS